MAERPPIHVHGITIDPGRWVVLVEGVPISLTRDQFLLLYTLANKPGRVLTRQQIMESIRGSDDLLSERSVNVQVFTLRRLLGDHGKLIRTVRGVGYSFQAGEIAATAGDESDDDPSHIARKAGSLV